jgi:hypothetical protein
MSWDKDAKFYSAGSGVDVQMCLETNDYRRCALIKLLSQDGAVRRPAKRGDGVELGKWVIIRCAQANCVAVLRFGSLERKVWRPDTLTHEQDLAVPFTTEDAEAGGKAVIHLLRLGGAQTGDLFK